MVQLLAQVMEVKVAMETRTTSEAVHMTTLRHQLNLDQGTVKQRVAES